MKKKFLSMLLAVIVIAQIFTVLCVNASAWSWSTDGKYWVNSYNAPIVSNGSITVDAQLDHLYLAGTKITNYPDKYLRSTYSDEAKALADGSFFAYVAADAKGMYIYAEIEDSTIYTSSKTNGNGGDYMNIYFDWVEAHPTTEERTSDWSASEYLSTYGSDQNLGWLSADYQGNIKGSQGFSSYTKLGPNKNQSATYMYRLTDSGWALEWFIPWRDQEQKNAIKNGQTFPCGIGFQVGDDSELTDGTEQDVVIRFDQRQEIGLRYYSDYSTLSEINFINGYETEKIICTVSKKSDVVCSHCGEILSENKSLYVSSSTPESHVWVASAENCAADCENDGLEKTECKYCGAVKEETVIPALGHSYEFNQREARYICSTCRGRADKGDINGDGDVTNSDVLEMFRYIYSPVLYPVEYAFIADVNGDGDITNADVLSIFRYIYNSELYPLAEKLPEVLVSGKNLSDYVIIYPAANPYGEKEFAEKLAAAIKDKYDLDIEVFADDVEVFGYEIIIGRADRDVSKNVYSETFEYDQYTVSVSENSIALGYAENKFAPSKAADALISMITEESEIETRSGEVVAEKVLNSACFSDMHNMYTMLEPNNRTGNYVLRQTHVTAVNLLKERYGQLDVVLVGGDLMSDYPSWDSSGKWPYKYYTAYKKLLVDLFAGLAKDGKVMYNAGNHDYAQGEAATDGPGIGGSYNSHDFYFDGPMKDTLGELAPEDMHMIVGTHTGEKYLLGYHYVVNGVHFIGLAPDPDNANIWSKQEYGFHPGTLKWFKETLERIDPNGDEIIFVNCHYPIAERTNDVIKDGQAKTDFVPLIKGHSNLFWMFGHHHTGEQEVAQSHTSEMIVHFDKNGNTVNTPAISTSYDNAADRGPTAVYMGAGRIDYSEKYADYFNNDKVYGDGGSGGWQGVLKQNTYGGTATPKLCQVMFFTVYEDRVEFQSINVGTYTGYTVNDIVVPYTVYFYK